MNKPTLEDFGLTSELLQEVIASNKKHYYLYWFAVNGLAVLMIIAVVVFVPASFSSRLLMVGGLLAILYPFNYIALFKFLVRPFFKVHPLHRKVVEYRKAVLKYQSFISSQSK